jgi:3-polyprenyl-4-hydroxybenzoate decarboxylase
LVDLNVYEMGGSAQVVAVAVKNPVPGEAWTALRAVAACRNVPAFKWIVAVDDDIDITELDSVLWALAWRVQPHRDIQIQRGRNTDLDPSGAPVDAPFVDRTYPDGLGGSQILIDATRKWAYPPISLPAKHLMEAAKRIWDGELKLPTLTPRQPWHSYELGFWPEGWAKPAERAIAGEYLKTGEEFHAIRTGSSYLETGTIVESEGE